MVVRIASRLAKVLATRRYRAAFSCCDASAPEAQRPLGAVSRGASCKEGVVALYAADEDQARGGAAEALG